MSGPSVADVLNHVETDEWKTSKRFLNIYGEWVGGVCLSDILTDRESPHIKGNPRWCRRCAAPMRLFARRLPRPDSECNECGEAFMFKSHWLCDVCADVQTVGSYDLHCHF